MALSSELSLDSLLQRLTELAAELTGARYAALGVVDPSGSRLERFITHGIDDDAPTGRPDAFTRSEALHPCPAPVSVRSSPAGGRRAPG